MLAVRRLVLTLTALPARSSSSPPAVWPHPRRTASSEALGSKRRCSPRALPVLLRSDPATVPSPEERYYSSYGDPEPLTAPQAPEPSAATPWAVLAASIAGAGTLVLLGVIVLRRRHAGSADPGDSPGVHAILRVWSRHLPRI
jgi:hypothetical protein